MLTAEEKPETPSWSGIGDFDVVIFPLHPIIKIHRPFLPSLGTSSLSHVIFSSCALPRLILAGVGLAGGALVHGRFPSQVHVPQCQIRVFSHWTWM